MDKRGTSVRGQALLLLVTRTALSRFSAAFSELLLSFRIKFGNFAGFGLKWAALRSFWSRRHLCKRTWPGWLLMPLIPSYHHPLHGVCTVYLYVCVCVFVVVLLLSPFADLYCIITSFPKLPPTTAATPSWRQREKVRHVSNLANLPANKHDGPAPTSRPTVHRHSQSNCVNCFDRRQFTRFAWLGFRRKRLPKRRSHI